jgi:hypothetical protein
MKISQSAKALFPPHNRISCYAALSTAACAAFIEESRMKPVETTKLGRKSETAGAPTTYAEFLGGHAICPVCL